MFCPKAERQAACCNVAHAWCDIFMTYMWHRSCDIPMLRACDICQMRYERSLIFIVGLLGWLDGLMSSVPKAHFSRPSDLFESSLTERNWTWTRWRPHLSDGCFSATINAMIACSGWRLSSLSLVRSYHRRAQPFAKLFLFLFCYIAIFPGIRRLQKKNGAFRLITAPVRTYYTSEARNNRRVPGQSAIRRSSWIPI